MVPSVAMSVPQSYRDEFQTSLGHANTRGCNLTMNFVGAEEKSDFCSRRLSSVRTVHGILLNVLPKILANSAWRRLRGIGASHDFTIFLDTAFTLHHRHKYSPHRH